MLYVPLDEQEVTYVLQRGESQWREWVERYYTVTYHDASLFADVLYRMYSDTLVQLIVDYLQPLRRPRYSLIINRYAYGVQQRTSYRIKTVDQEYCWMAIVSLVPGSPFVRLHLFDSLQGKDPDKTPACFTLYFRYRDRAERFAYLWSWLYHKL